MKADARPDSGGGPERGELRAILRHWRVPEAPPELEEALRREFRRRRSPRRRVLWLSLAAGLTLLATWQILTSDLPSRRVPPRATVAVAPAMPAVLAPAETDRAADATAVASDPAGARRRAIPAPSEPEVIVEPAQGELLAELARGAWGTRPMAPGTVFEQMPAAETPPYRGEWETVAGEWPQVQRFVPNSGR
jgi:hypothetical protein